MSFGYSWRRVSLPFVRRLAPKVVIAADHFRLRVDLRDTAIASTLYSEGTWEAEIVRLLRMLDLRAGVCVDVGANIGWHTLVLSECAGPAGKVFAFEPNPRDYRLLLENLKLNHAGNVQAERSALGDCEATSRLWLHPRNWGDNRIVAKLPGATLSESVAVRTGDRCLAAVPAGAIKLVKVDTQGYDHFVVRGMHDSLMRNPEAVLIVEVAPMMLRDAGTSASAFVRYLVDLGFGGWDIQLHRAIPLLAPEQYEMMYEAGEAVLALSRKPETLSRVIRRIYSQPA